MNDAALEHRPTDGRPPLRVVYALPHELLVRWVEGRERYDPVDVT
jgi:hypothetical protein